MTLHLQSVICVLVIQIVFILAKEDDLPLCPTNINYLPQSLPMHCRMPRSANYPFFPGSLPNFTFPPLPPGFPSPDKGGAPIPFPMPPGMPGVPGPPGLPGPAPAPVPMHMHMPMMPMPPPGPAHKVPVIVMPFYSPEGARKPAPGGPRHKKRRVHVNKKRFPPYHSESDTDTDTGTSETDDSRYSSSDTSSSDGGGAWWGGRRSGGRFGGKHAHQRRRHKANADFLTPIIQYVTKDGYVIFEKKISKDQASDWLQEKKERNGREYNKPPRDENKSKNEEEEALQEYDNATTETVKRRNANAKAISEIEKIKGRMHKTPHRHQPKKLARKEK